MSISGSIPEKLAIHFSKSEKLKGKFVVPAFVVDANNERTNKTASSWAGKGAQIVKKDNVPFGDVKILRLDIRGNGGRAYQVLIEGDFCVDLRERELLWVMENKGISKGSILGGEFIFARVASQMKIIPYKSELYYELVKQKKQDLRKCISSKKLKAGYVYEKKNGDKDLFIGFVKCEKNGKMEKMQLWQGRYDCDKNLSFYYCHLVKSRSVVVECYKSSKPTTVVDVKNFFNKMLLSGSRYDVEFNSKIRDMIEF